MNKRRAASAAKEKSPYIIRRHRQKSPSPSQLFNRRKTALFPRHTTRKFAGAAINIARPFFPRFNTARAQRPSAYAKYTARVASVKASLPFYGPARRALNTCSSGEPPALLRRKRARARAGTMKNHVRANAFRALLSRFVLLFPLSRRGIYRLRIMPNASFIASDTAFLFGF